MATNCPRLSILVCHGCPDLERLWAKKEVGLASSSWSHGLFIDTIIHSDIISFVQELHSTCYSPLSFIIIVEIKGCGAQQRVDLRMCSRKPSPGGSLTVSWSWLLFSDVATEFEFRNFEFTQLWTAQLLMPMFLPLTWLRRDLSQERLLPTRCLLASPLTRKYVGNLLQIVDPTSCACVVSYERVRYRFKTFLSILSNPELDLGHIAREMEEQCCMLKISGMFLWMTHSLFLQMVCGQYRYNVSYLQQA